MNDAHMVGAPWFHLLDRVMCCTEENGVRENNKCLLSEMMGTESWPNLWGWWACQSLPLNTRPTNGKGTRLVHQFSPFSPSPWEFRQFSLTVVRAVPTYKGSVGLDRISNWVRFFLNRTWFGFSIAKSRVRSTQPNTINIHSAHFFFFTPTHYSIPGHSFPFFSFPTKPKPIPFTRKIAKIALHFCVRVCV